MAHAMHAGATITKHIRDRVSAFARKRFFMGYLTANGRIVYNMSGDGYDWPIRIKRAEFNPFTETTQVSFPQANYNIKAALPVRGGWISESIHRFNKNLNKGAEAIVKLWANKIAELSEDFADHMGMKLINNDGNATGNSYVHGLESCLSATSNAGYRVGTNNDSYGGFSTARGTFGSAGSGTAATWPAGGSYNPEYDCWTPVVIDTTSTAWDASAASFANYGDRQLGFGAVYSRRNQYKLDCWLLSKDGYLDIVNLNRGKQRIEVSRNTKMTAMGFQGMSMDGVDIYEEDAVTSGYGYGLVPDVFELGFWHDKMVETDEDFDLSSVSDKALVTSMHQLRIKTPRALTKIAPLT